MDRAKKLPMRDFFEDFFFFARDNILPLLSPNNRSVHTSPPPSKPAPTAPTMQQPAGMPPAVRPRATRCPQSRNLVNPCSQQQPAAAILFSVYFTLTVAVQTVQLHALHRPRSAPTTPTTGRACLTRQTWCRASFFQGIVAATTRTHHYTVAVFHENGA